MFTAICSNTSFFPGEDGVPSLPVFTPEPDELISVYGNVGNPIAYNLVLSSNNPNITISNTSIISKPNFYNVTKISQTNYRFVQNAAQVFVGEKFDFVLFDDDGNVIGEAEEMTLPPNVKKTPYNYTAPTIKEILADIHINFGYLEIPEGGGMAVVKSANVHFIQTHFWNWRIAINRLTDFVNTGDY